MSDTDDTGTVSLNELPESVCENIVRDIGSFSVALFGISNSTGDERLTFCGSGTLVSSGDFRYILTATHVWTKKLRAAEQLALTFVEGASHRFAIDTQTVTPDISFGPGAMEEWGPDFCFLRIPPAYVGRIEVYKTFYNLDKRREHALTSQLERDAGPCVLMGSPSELFDELSDKHANWQFPGWFSRIQDVHSREGFDYLDVGVDLSLSEIPSSFGGVSGGGLWQVLIGRSTQTGDFLWKRNLEGVAFYASPAVAGRRIIRCHGRHSIYGNMPHKAAV